MIEEVKKIVVKRYKEEYNRVYKEYYDITFMISTLEIDLHKLESEIMYPVEKKHFSLIQKVLTKRGEYKEYKKEGEEQNQKVRKASEIRTKLFVEKTRTEKKIQELEEKLQQLKKIDFSEMENAKVIKSLGINLFEAFSILEKNNIPIVLTEADKIVTKVESDYSSKGDVIGVHKTQFAPTGSKIRTAKDVKAVFKDTITINGQKYEYEYMSERDTVHMAMNGEVSSHTGGCWDDCKYSILIPMSDIPNEKIGYANSVDTFTKGSLSLSQNCWILCPINEVEQIKKNNPKVNVIGYEGKSVFGYSGPFLSALGYKAEDIGMGSWCNEESRKQFERLMKKEGIKIKQHFGTYFYEDEKTLTEINSLVSICKVIKDNGLIKDSKDIPDVVEQLSNTVFKTRIERLCLGSNFKNGQYPDAIKGNHKHLDIFFSKMQENGFELSDNYKTIFRRIEQIGIEMAPDFNQLIQGVNLSENEKKVLGIFYNALLRPGFIKPGINKNSEYAIKFMSVVVLDSISRSKSRIVTSKLDDELDR